MKNKSKPRIPVAIWILIALFLVRSFIYASFTPAWQGPDEPLHYDYIHYLQTEKSLPVLGKTVLCKKVRSSLNSFHFNAFVQEKSPYFQKSHLNTKEFKVTQIKHQHKDVKQNQIVQHPPLYYLIAAAITWPFKDSSLLTSIWILRILSALLSLGVVIFTYLTVDLIFGKNRLPTIAATSFVALNPMFAHISTIINNDSLANFLFAFFIYLLARSIKFGVTSKRAISIAVVIGLGLMTKFFFALAFPMLIIAILLFMPKFLVNYRPVGIMLLGPVVASPYYLRNIKLYGTLQPVFKFHFEKLNVYKEMGFMQFLWASEFSRKLFISFWSNFGWVKPRFIKTLYQPLFLIAVLAFIGLLIYLYRQKSKGNDLQYKMVGLWFGSLLLLGLAIGLNAFKEARLGGVVEGVQGRYFFSLIGPIGLMLYLGIRQLIPYKKGYLAFGLFIGGLVLLDFSALFYYILPYFYF